MTQRYHRLPEGQITTDTDNVIQNAKLKELLAKPVTLDKGNLATDSGTLAVVDASTLVVRNVVAGGDMAIKSAVGIVEGRAVKSDGNSNPIVRTVGIVVKAAAAAGDLVDIALSGTIIGTGMTPGDTVYTGAATAGVPVFAASAVSTELVQKIGTVLTATTYQLQIDNDGTIVP